MTIFRSFIYSYFNCCPLAWHFWNTSNTRKMGKIQDTIPLKDLLIRNNLTYLHVRRIKSMALEVFKIINKIYPECLHDLFKQTNPFYNFRKDNTVDLPIANTARYAKRSFRFEAAQVWNNLPNDMRLAETYNLSFAGCCKPGMVLCLNVIRVLTS